MNAIEIAKKMETDAIEFYTEAGNKIKYPAGKKMFETVVADERKHLEVVNKILQGMQVNIDDVPTLGNIRTVFEDLKDEMMEKVEASSEELEALKIAMQMEKEGAAFYRKLAAEAKTEQEKELFTKLIKEEEKHFEIFENTFNFLDDTGNWFTWNEHAMFDGGTPTA
ncbi:MAG: ferritin family protein [Nitrospira sp.]|nr:ferritin family protein [bacterium]MBL7048119.1 ferritin family protein [Nitrospira sp.]